MRLAAAALLLVGALSAHAQTPPDSPPAASPQAAPAPDQPTDAQPSPDVVTTEQAEQPAPRPPPPVRAPAARPQAVAAAPAAAAAPHPTAQVDQQLQALHAEVNRLQSELDAERAAGLAATEELRGAQSAHGIWGWLALAAALALAAGFVLGWRVLDRRIRRKYGGLRIY